MTGDSLFPFRLVRVQHDRCGEYDGTEYVLAPIDWDAERVRAEIRVVVEETIADAKAIKEAPLNPPHHPPYAEHPDKTVAAVQALHAAQRAAFSEWNKKNLHLSRSFVERMRERGFVALWDDEAETGAYTAGAYWGHNHGLKLNYQHSEV
jgi:hypothetical protein